MGKHREGNDRLRAPDELLDLGDWLADAHREYEKKRGNRRGISSGHALLLLLASFGMTKQPTSEPDLTRMREIRNLATTLARAQPGGP